MTGDRDAAPWPLWLRIALIAAVVAVLVAPLVLWREDIGLAFANRERVVEDIRSAGAWGPLVLIGLAVSQTIVAPIPGQAINLAAGYLYGPWFGLVYSWIGLVLGSGLAMLLGRYAGRPLVERLVSARSLDQLDRLVAGKGLGFFFLFFLIPGLPDDVLCFVAGLTTLPLRVLWPMAAVVRIPGLVVAVWLGARAEDVSWPVWVVFGVLGLVAVVLVWRFGDSVQAALMARIGRCGRQKS
jgi:uncharacterized membrane protein YdjX (TVP38/TMEM64 family)